MIAQPLSIAAETSTAVVETPFGSTVGPSTDETPPPEPSGSQQVIAQPLSIAAETSVAGVVAPLGSTVRPSIDEAPPAEPSGSQQVIAEPLVVRFTRARQFCLNRDWRGIATWVKNGGADRYVFIGIVADAGPCERLFAGAKQREGGDAKEDNDCSSDKPD